MSATGFLDACGFIPASNGTGNFVVSGNVQGYQTPASAGAVNSTVYSYRAESADKSQWEVGFGAYTVSTTTLARTTIKANSSGGTSAINFSAAPNVFITAATADLSNASLLTSGTLPFGQLPITSLTASLGSDVAVSTSSLTDGPSISQGTSGTWFVTATVTFLGTSGSIIFAKLWDGTTTIASTGYNQMSSAARQTLSLSGIITNPAGNLRVSAEEANGATTSFKASTTGFGKDCTISAVRIA